MNFFIIGLHPIYLAYKSLELHSKSQMIAYNISKAELIWYDADDNVMTRWLQIKTPGIYCSPFQNVDVSNV